MDVVIFNGKLSITPENLFPLVQSFVITYPHRDESGRTTRSYYRAQQVPNSASIHINNDQDEWVGDVLVIPFEEEVEQPPTAWVGEGAKDGFIFHGHIICGL
jgi:hypothetical protein